MINNVYKVEYTGVVALAHTLAPNLDFRIKEIRVHLSAAGGAGNLTATVDAIGGVVYDINLLTQDMTAVTDLVYIPDGEGITLFKGDEIDFAWANAGGKSYGLVVVYEVV